VRVCVHAVTLLQHPVITWPHINQLTGEMISVETGYHRYVSRKGQAFACSALSATQKPVLSKILR